MVYFNSYDTEWSLAISSNNEYTRNLSTLADLCRVDTQSDDQDRQTLSIRQVFGSYVHHNQLNDIKDVHRIINKFFQ